MRAEYAQVGLDEAAAGDDPFVLFDRWLADAVSTEIVEPNAMALATATPDGRPSVRIVLLKGVDNKGMVFYTNYESRKAEELAANPFASAVFLWHPLSRQVRIEGEVEQIAPADSDAYFASRPRGSQLGALASPQSRAVTRSELEARYENAESHFAGREVERPEHWGGYRIHVHTIEFWQGRPDRMHDRIVFTRSGGGWSIERLAP